MNKQGLIERLEKASNVKNWHYEDLSTELLDITYELRNVFEQLDEPSREECDYFTAPYNYGESTDIDYNICNICRYHEKCDDKFKSNFDVWNYCPNCGGKIKRR